MLFFFFSTWGPRIKPHDFSPLCFIAGSSNLSTESHASLLIFFYNNVDHNNICHVSDLSKESVMTDSIIDV